MDHAACAGFTVKDITFSPIRGPEGNIEYLGYLQAGEPYSHELDSESGRWRATYMTFRMVGRDWQYCGCCFLGGTEQPQALTDRLNRESGERRL